MQCLTLACATLISSQRHQKEFELTVQHLPAPAQPRTAKTQTNAIHLNSSQNISRPHIGILRPGVCVHKLVWGSGCNCIIFVCHAHPEVRLLRASAASTLLQVIGLIRHLTGRSLCRQPRFIREIVTLHNLYTKINCNAF